MDDRKIKLILEKKKAECLSANASAGSASVVTKKLTASANVINAINRGFN